MSMGNDGAWNDHNFFSGCIKTNKALFNQLELVSLNITYIYPMYYIFSKIYHFINFLPKQNFLTMNKSDNRFCVLQAYFSELTQDK